MTSLLFSCQIAIVINKHLFSRRHSKMLNTGHGHPFLPTMETKNDTQRESFRQGFLTQRESFRQCFSDATCVFPVLKRSWSQCIACFRFHWGTGYERSQRNKVEVPLLQTESGKHSQHTTNICTNACGYHSSLAIHGQPDHHAWRNDSTDRKTSFPSPTLTLDALQERRKWNRSQYSRRIHVWQQADHLFSSPFQCLRQLSRRFPKSLGPGACRKIANHVGKQHQQSILQKLLVFQCIQWRFLCQCHHWKLSRRWWGK